MLDSVFGPNHTVIVVLGVLAVALTLAMLVQFLFFR